MSKHTKLMEGVEPLEVFLEADLEELLLVSERSRTSNEDLSAAAEWMLLHLPTAVRRVLVGLVERVDTFTNATAVVDDLLELAGSFEKAAWAMEHERLLLANELSVAAALVKGADLRVILFLLELFIDSHSRVYDHILELRDHLQETLKAANDHAG